MWWIFEICLSLILYTAGTAVYFNWGVTTQHIANISQLAADTAVTWDQYADALDAYVQSNINDPGGLPETVTCQDLQNGGYLSTSFGNGNCTDPTGEQLVGYVASPWGFPQSWMVMAASGPASDILAKYGFSRHLGVAPSAASSTAPPSPNSWEAFTMQVAKDAVSNEQQGSYTGAVIQMGSDARGQAMPNPGAFMIPASTAGYNSMLSQYFPTSGVPEPQTVPITYGYNGYAILVAPALQINPGYWLFNGELITGGGTSYIDWTNKGYSSICPSNGITPGTPPGDWTLDCNNSNGGISAPHGGCWWTNATNHINYTNVYACIPASKTVVDSTQDFPDVSSINYDYQNYMVSTNGSYFIGVENANQAQQWQAPLGVQVLYISIGSNTYTLMSYIGFYQDYCTIEGSDLLTAIMALWIGTPPSSGRCAANGVEYPCYQPSDLSGPVDGMVLPVWGLPSGYSAQTITLN